jgi:uncharacterized membrane protein
MKKALLFILILTLSILPIFSKDKDKSKDKVEKVEKTETAKPESKDSMKLKADMKESVLEFIGDLKVNPDSCYIPFKK